MKEDHVSLIKFFTTLILFYYIGIIKGVLFLFLFLTSINFVLKNYFDLEPLSSGDLNFVGDEKQYNYNMIAFLRIKDISPEKVKQIIIERSLEHYARLRKKLVYRFHSFYWKNATNEEVLSRIQIINDYDLETKDDIAKYTEEWMNDIFPINTLQWEARIIRIRNSNDGLLMWKFDHSYSDGIGLISMIFTLSDNYSLDMFPKLRSPSLLQKVIAYSMFPYYFFICIYHLYFAKKSKSPFKANVPIKGTRKTYWSKKLPFKKMNLINKKLGITFNDLMITVIGATLKKLGDKHGIDNIEYYDGIIPINARPPPKNTNDLVLSNETSFSPIKIKLVDDVMKEAKAVSKYISPLTKNYFLFNSFMTLNKFTLFLPRFFAKFVNRYTSTKFDLIISNVPGPRIPLLYSDSPVVEMVPVPNTGYHKGFIGIVSYNEEFILTITFDDSVQLSPKTFVELFEEEVDKLVSTLQIN